MHLDNHLHLYRGCFQGCALEYMLPTTPLARAEGARASGWAASTSRSIPSELTRGPEMKRACFLAQTEVSRAAQKENEQRRIKQKRECSGVRKSERVTCSTSAWKFVPTVYAVSAGGAPGRDALRDPRLCSSPLSPDRTHEVSSKTNQKSEQRESWHRNFQRNISKAKRNW